MMYCKLIKFNYLLWERFKICLSEYIIMNYLYSENPNVSALKYHIIERLLEIYSANKQNYNNLNDKFNQCNKTTQELQGKVTRNKDKKSDLRGENASLNKTIALFEQQIEDITVDNQRNIKKINDEYNDKVKALNTTIEGMTNKNKELAGYYQKNKETILKNDSEIKRLTEEKGKMAEDYKKKIEDESEAHGTLIKSYNELEKKIETFLKTNIVDSNQRYNDCVANTKKLSDEVEKLKKNNIDMQKESEKNIKKLKDKEKNLKSTLKDSTQQYNGCMTDTKKLSDEVEKLKKNNIDMQKESEKNIKKLIDSIKEFYDFFSKELIAKLEVEPFNVDIGTGDTVNFSPEQSLLNNIQAFNTKELTSQNYDDMIELIKKINPGLQKSIEGYELSMKQSKEQLYDLTYNLKNMSINQYKAIYISNIIDILLSHDLTQNPERSILLDLKKPQSLKINNKEAHDYINLITEKLKPPQTYGEKLNNLILDPITSYSDCLYYFALWEGNMLDINNCSILMKQLYEKIDTEIDRNEAKEYFIILKFLLTIPYTAKTRDRYVKYFSDINKIISAKQELRAFYNKYKNTITIINACINAKQPQRDANIIL